LTESGNGPDGEPGGGRSRRGFAAGYGKAYEIIAAALQLAAAVVVMLLVGQWLDGKLGTGPWLMLAGLMTGFAGGFYSFMRSIQKLAKTDNTKGQG
jgi:F0F1-type ATP synthase assembly protein I